MILLTPGPTSVPEAVRYSMSAPSIHHRTKEFECIFENTRNMLKKLFKQDEIVILSSSGTGAMDCAIQTFCQSKALIINAGKFGERFVKMADFYNMAYKELKYDWDTPSNTQDIIDAIKNDEKIDSIFIQICESSGGLRHPVEQIAKEIKNINQDIVVVADAITAIGVEDIDATNIDVLITGSQKALMLPPGLSIMGFSQYALEKIKINDSKSFYFDLKKELKIQQTNTTAYTPATTLIIGLEKILKLMNEEGFEQIYKKTQNRAIATRKAMEAIGLKIYPKTPALAMSSIYHDKASQILKILKEKYNLHIAGGQDHLKGNLFRINNMGIIDLNKMLWIANSVEMALSDLGIREYDGTASKVFSKAIL